MPAQQVGIKVAPAAPVASSKDSSDVRFHSDFAILAERGALADLTDRILRFPFFDKAEIMDAHDMLSYSSSLISVIMPVYNAAEFLEYSVISACNQPEVGEVILIEDGSEDSSLTICMRLQQQNEKVKLYRHPDRGNHGSASSRNLGVAKASHDWISFLDADDFYLHNRFAITYKVLSENKDADGVYEAVGTVYENADCRKLWKENTQLADLTTLSPGIQPEKLFYFWIGNRHGHVHLNGFTVRKKTLLEIGGFPKSLRLHQDTAMFIRLINSYRLIPGSLREPVAQRRVHGKNRIAKPGFDFSLTRMMLWGDLLKWSIAEKIHPLRRLLVLNSFLHSRANYYKKNGKPLNSTFYKIPSLVLKKPCQIIIDYHTSLT